MEGVVGKESKMARFAGVEKNQIAAWEVFLMKHELGTSKVSVRDLACASLLVVKKACKWGVCKRAKDE